jgi:hypothetical protein
MESMHVSLIYIGPTCVLENSKNKKIKKKKGKEHSKEGPSPSIRATGPLEGSQKEKWIPQPSPP